MGNNHLDAYLEKALHGLEKWRAQENPWLSPGARIVQALGLRVEWFMGSLGGLGA